jgi:LysR family transcriptional regulator for bpeEF and oprC
MDKLTAMHTFVQVVDSGGFGRAADLMQVPRARVTQRIQALENNLGVRLLQRTTRTTQVTPDGRAYYEQCVQLLANIDNMEDALRGGGSAPSGPIRVDVLASIARQIIAPALPDFTKRYPGIVLRLGCTDRVVNLLEEGVDCAIRGGELADSTLVARKMCEVNMGLYATPGYLQSYGIPSHPSDLAAHACIGEFSARSGQTNKWTLTRREEQLTFSPSTKLEFNDGDAALNACLAGGGIVSAAPFTVIAHVRNRNLQPVLPQWSAGLRPVHIVYPTSRHLSARVRCFVDWATHLISNDQVLRLEPAGLVEWSEHS